jgi:sporulation protein YlmC with PRC-barrel domain
MRSLYVYLIYPTNINYKYSIFQFKNMLRVKKVSEIVGKNVFTSDGDFFGQIDDVNLSDNKIDGWKIKVGSSFLSVFGGARGVVIPHQFVRAIGDVVIINKASLPARQEMEMPAFQPSAETGEAY